MNSDNVKIISEAILWQKFKSGDEEAFSVIYHRYFNDMYNYGLKIAGGGGELTKDCIQELFIDLWTRKENLGDVKSIKFYLLKSLRRSINKKLESKQQENLQIQRAGQMEPQIDFSSEEFLINDEISHLRSEYISRILNQLPARRKEAIYLKYFKNLSYPEIAEVMGLTEKAVVNHIYKAFKALKLNNRVSNLSKIISSVLVLFIFL